MLYFHVKLIDSQTKFKGGLQMTCFFRFHGKKIDYVEKR